MKQLIAIFALAATCSFATQASDLEQAPAETYNEIVQTCQEWAQEDEVEAAGLKLYMSDCIKNELENLGYAPVVNSTEAAPATNEE